MKTAPVLRELFVISGERGENDERLTLLFFAFGIHAQQRMIQGSGQFFPEAGVGSFQGRNAGGELSDPFSSGIEGAHIREKDAQE